MVRPASRDSQININSRREPHIVTHMYLLGSPLPHPTYCSLHHPSNRINESSGVDPNFHRILRLSHCAPHLSFTDIRNNIRCVLI